MSTYWYFECADHDPPMRAREEFTQHTKDEHYWRGISLANSRPVHRDDSYWSFIGSDEESTERYFSIQARAFLVDHPKCRIRVVNEYNEYGDEEGATVDPQ